MKIIFSFEGKNKEEFLIDKSSVLIGRSKECDICLPYDGFSRRHALIEFIDDEFFITDLNSTNGILIDGDKIPPSKRVAIKSFLTLQIGTAYRVEVFDEASVAPVPTDIADNKNSSDLLASKRNQTAGTSSLTRAIKMPIQKQTKKSEGANIIKIAILPAMILGGAIYLSYEFGENKQDPSSNSGSSVEKNQGIPIIEPFFLPKALLISNQSYINCKEANSTWCQSSGVTEGNREGAIIQGRSLIVYMNMTELMKSESSINFKQLGELERLKIFMLKRIIDSTILNSLTSQTSLDNLQVVGFFQEKPLLAIKFMRNIDIDKIDRVALGTAFRKVFLKGKIDELVNLASFYETLPLD